MHDPLVSPAAFSAAEGKAEADSPPGGGPQAADEGGGGGRGVAAAIPYLSERGEDRGEGRYI